MMREIGFQKPLSTALCIALLVTTALASTSGKLTGELISSGQIMVNGEAAKNGRSIFSSSNISTLDGTTAVINIVGLGSVELAPKSNIVLTFDANGINGNLTAGELTVLGTSSTVIIKTANEGFVTLNAGESVTADGILRKRQDDPNTIEVPWWGWVAIAAVAVVAVTVIVVATQNDDDDTVVSPTR